MFGITDLTAYLIGTIAIILLPGPNSMYCLTVAGQYGAKTAYRSISGILLGDSILILATVLGAGTVLKMYPPLFHAVKLLGGLYLAYLGIQLLRGAVKKWYSEPNVHTSVTQTEPPKHIFKRALVLSLANPKAILFFLSFFVQFAAPDYPQPMLTFFVLAVILQIISFAYLSMLVFAGDRLVRAFRRYAKISAVSMGMVGLMFAGFAVKLWTAAI